MEKCKIRFSTLKLHETNCNIMHLLGKHCPKSPKKDALCIEISALTMYYIL